MTVAVTLEREQRRLDPGQLQWGIEKTIETRLETIGTVKQGFVNRHVQRCITQIKMRMQEVSEAKGGAVFALLPTRKRNDWSVVCRDQMNILGRKTTPLS